MSFSALRPVLKKADWLQEGRLAAVAAVLGAAAGLDRQQLRQLQLGRVEPAPVDAGGLEHQLGERQVEQRLDLLARPIVARQGGIGETDGRVHAGITPVGGSLLANLPRQGDPEWVGICDWPPGDIKISLCRRCGGALRRL